MGTIRIYANKSAWIDSQNQNINHSSEMNLIIEDDYGASYPYATNSVALVKYDLSQLSKKRVIGGRFYVYLNKVIYTNFLTGEKDKYRIFIGRIPKNWEEKEVTFTSFNYTLDEMLATYDNTVAFAEKNNIWVNTTSSRELDDNFINYGVLIKCGENARRVDIASSRSSNKPYVDITYEDVAVSPANMSPTGGVIDEKAENVFSWMFSYNKNNVVGEIKQKSAVFQWRNTQTTGIINTVNISGEETKVVIPKNTLPNGSIEWRVQVTGDNNISSSWDWMKISTVDNVKTDATGLRPDMSYVEGAKINRFEWVSISSVGTLPLGYDIQKSKDGINWVDLIHGNSRESFCNVPADSFESGTQFWRVRTYNSDNIPGNWSNAAQITVIAAPPEPTIISVSNENTPYVKWIAEKQIGWRIQVIRGNDLLYDSDICAGNDREHRIKTVFRNGLYTVRLCTIGEHGIASVWNEYIWNVETIPPASIQLAGKTDRFCNKLEWSVSKDIRDYWIVRDGKPIKEVGSTYYDDFTACGSHEYFIRVIVGGAISESNKVRLALYPQSTTIAPATEPSNFIACKYSTERSQATYSDSKTVQLQNVSGREKPVAEFTDFESFHANLKYAENIKERFFLLRDLYRKGIPLIFRNRHGERQFVIISSLSYTIIGSVIDYSFTIDGIDYSEVEGEHFEGYSLLHANGLKFYVKDKGK